MQTEYNVGLFAYTYIYIIIILIALYSANIKVLSISLVNPLGRTELYVHEGIIQEHNRRCLFGSNCTGFLVLRRRKKSLAYL